MNWTTSIYALSVGNTKELRQLLREAERQGGWIGRRDSRGHILLRHTLTGEHVSVSGTTGSSRAIHNTRAALRRAERNAK